MLYYRCPQKFSLLSTGNTGPHSAETLPYNIRVPKTEISAMVT
uniref:Uncharacterized protein n=1 Tax=Rhizophora mucronata TaxID=61149 RepID=A0A2P2NJ16_RHIMU